MSETAGQKLRRHLDQALADAVADTGPLEFDEIELMTIDRAAVAAGPVTLGPRAEARLMPRRPANVPGSSALYAALLAREEAEAAIPCEWPRPGNVARLQALRAGRPVDVCVGDLPPWARAAESARWSRRAIVTATGVVEFYDDTGSIWAAEAGV